MTLAEGGCSLGYSAVGDGQWRIHKNGEHRVIDLRGVGKRSLRKIELSYDTAGASRGRADATVFGTK